MKRKKYIAFIAALAMAFSVKNICIDTLANNNYVAEDVVETIQLSDVVEEAEYPEAATDSNEWVVNEESEYEFPIDENSSEWKEYDSHDEMIEACTIPEEVLQNASTEQLLEMVLDYPLLCDIYLYDTVEEGIAKVASDFNGFQELMSRADFEENVLGRYLTTDIKDATDNNEEIFTEVSEIVLLEDILAQKDVIDSFSDEQIDTLVDSVEEKTEKKMNNEAFEGNESTFYDVSSENGVIDELDIKDLPELVDDTVSGSGVYTTVKTPKGTKVSVYQDSYYGDQWALAIYNDVVKRYPQATCVGPADNRYNCHSYAWYKRSASNRYWMNDPSAYMSDGSYSYAGKSPKKGQKVVYIYKGAYEHSAIAVDDKNTLESKWGQGPIMKHNKDYSPYHSADLKCYK